MALVVNTNIASLNSQYSLSQSRSALEQAMERLSTGSKINSAGDDAAGLAISTRMESQVRGLEAAISNANDGISLLQTAEGAMEEITAMLQRMRELAIQSSNGVNNQSDRDALNAEAQQLLSEIDRVVGETTFNKQAILDGSMSTQLQIGSEGGQSLAINLGNLSTYSLGADVASTSGQVQREASFAGSAVGSTDENGNNLVTATNVGLTFQSDDTYNFVMSLELKDNNGTTKTYEYDISGVVTGGSARDVALEIQSALRKPPISAGTSGDAGTLTEVVNSAAANVDVTYSGNTIQISNRFGGDVTVEAGNYRNENGIQSTIGGALSESGGVIHFTTQKQYEQDGSLISDATSANVVLGTQPAYIGTSFNINSVDPTTTTTDSTEATEATAATLEVALADISDATYATLNEVSTGDSIAFALVDEDGDKTLVFTDEVAEMDGSSSLVGALNNALISAGSYGTDAGAYVVTWGDNASGGSTDGTATTPGTFTISRADGKNFTIITDVSDFGAIDSSYAATETEIGSGSVGFMQAVTDLSVADETITTADDDITLVFADQVAGSVGASSVFAQSDGFTVALTDEDGITSSITVDNLVDGSTATVVAALNTAFQNALIDDKYTASVETGGSDVTGGITLTHDDGQTFTVEFTDITGMSNASTVVIHEKLDDLEFGDTANTGLYSTNGVQESAAVSSSSTSTVNSTTMYLDVLGADDYTIGFNSTANPSSVTTSALSYSYDGTEAGLNTFAAQIQANLETLSGDWDFTVTADDGRIEITENNGTGFGVNSFSSEGSGRIMASADSSVIPTGQSGVVMFDDQTYVTNATADAGTAGINTASTEMKLTFTDATDTYSFSIETDDGVAKVNPFLYEACTGENADAVAAISVALQQAGLDGLIKVEAGTADNEVKLTAASGEEVRITNFTSEGSGEIQAESLAGTFGSGVTRIMNDDVYGASAALANLDISTANGAGSALDAIDRAIQGVSDERANIGALTNRLDYTISNLGNIVVNTSAAQSRIQDADFASEAAELAKAQVLQQAGTAILAQANASVQSVLSLLG